MHLFRALDAKWSSSRLPRTFVTTAVAGAIAITAWVLIMASAPLAQQAPLHLNPAIEKLAQGKPIIGTNTSDLSIENARSLARADSDYVYADMAQSPSTMAGTQNSLARMICN